MIMYNKDIKQQGRNMNNNSEEKKDKEILNSTHHTMFTSNVAEVSKEVIIGGKKYFEITSAHKAYRLFIDDFMEFERGLHEIYNILWDAGDSDTLELRINSNGGMVNEGSQFHSIIKNKFNGRTTTVLDNKGYSMGALLFSAGDKRVVTERADLMYHDYSTGMGGKAGEVQARNEHSQKFIRKYFREVVLDNGFLSKKEFKQMLVGQDYWMGVEELCKRGIATHVLVNGKEVKAKKYLKSLKKK